MFCLATAPSSKQLSSAGISGFSSAGSSSAGSSCAGSSAGTRMRRGFLACFPASQACAALATAARLPAPRVFGSCIGKSIVCPTSISKPNLDRTSGLTSSMLAAGGRARILSLDDSLQCARFSCCANWKMASYCCSARSLELKCDFEAFVPDRGAWAVNMNPGIMYSVGLA